MRRANFILGLVLSATLAATGAAAGPLDFVFDVLPPGGSVSGAPGDTVGWGYFIENTSLDWLETTGLSADPFSNGTPSSLFDFPILAPGASLSVSYDFLLGLGLYQLSWDAGAPVGSVNSGTFIVSATFWNGDPLDPASTPLGPANDQSSPYSARVAGAGVPEPATFLLLGSGLVALAGARARQRRP